MQLTTDGHTAISQSLKNSDFHLAWGKLKAGQTPWASDIPALSVGTDDLYNEIGRRAPSVKRYAYEDPNGGVIANGKRWTLTDTPTRNIYLQFKFDSTDSPDEVVYQKGLWMNTVTNVPKTAMTFHVVQTYPAGTTAIRLNAFSGGVLEDLLPVPNPSIKFGGRECLLSNNTSFRVLGLDTATSMAFTTPLPAEIAPAETLRCSEIFGVPLGKLYLNPSDLLDKGLLFMVENNKPVYRDNATREMYEYVLTF